MSFFNELYTVAGNFAESEHCHFGKNLFKQRKHEHKQHNRNHAGKTAEDNEVDRLLCIEFAERQHNYRVCDFNGYKQYERKNDALKARLYRFENKYCDDARTEITQKARITLDIDFNIRQSREIVDNEH